MENNKLILIVEDDPNLRDALYDTLALSNYQVITAASAEDALQLLDSKTISLIISDVQMPGIDGHEFLKISKRQYPDTPFVLITAFGNIPKAVEAIKNGAADYVIKPFEAEVLIEMVTRLLPATLDTGKMIIADKRSQELAQLAARVAATDVTVMISGESGTGKEVYSRFIHECSPRSNAAFCAINCAAIPEPMLESILFGYEKGAFTGAYTARAGKFEQANNGTLLLDEISEMDISLQAKLLRVIQEREVERLGGSKTIPLNVRIIATTNRDLKEEVAAGRFREDLFYRLNVFPLHLHPLRDRPADIIPLSQKFIEHLHPGQGIEFDAAAKQLLLSHYWKGNVRELENVIQRALILKSGPTINPEDIAFEKMSEASVVQLAPDTFNNAPELETNLRSREKEIIIDAVSSHRSRKEAAEKLGISPRTLRYKLAQFREDGISIPCFSDTARAS
ncbi:MAG: sigma-54-dependent Fis family transcriptional regulator [SAR86 cluster bacterium]|uniref:Sigma-54-dependent Fis family transcriptional regulator n=1 Tax=SAR86 cluster bacterium TaxID=2030880 RepID=A0A2A5B569_9GAMM|nr:MAG: sigma-54-dependent Fis family transcriptional regulator [SAR86 cluster bacterium]